jgi:CRP-like cAMP-binding protein
MFDPEQIYSKFNCSQCSDRSCAVAVLNQKQLEQLNNNSVETTIKKGEIILHAGSLNSNIIYLKSGHVKEYIDSRKNNSEILQIISPRSYLGLQSLFGDRVVRYSYSALEDLRICQIRIEVFKELIRDNGNFATEVLQYVCKENLNMMNRIVNRNYKKADGKFVDVLLYFADDIFQSDTFDLLLTRKELADLIGLSRENTIRVMSKFKSDELIEIDGKTIRLLNSEMIRKISKNG